MKGQRLVCILVCLLAAWASRGQEASASLLGEWNLKTVAGNAPATIRIGSLHIVFLRDGKWTYSAEMTGSLTGMQLKGAVVGGPERSFELHRRKQ